MDQRLDLEAVAPATTRRRANEKVAPRPKPETCSDQDTLNSQVAHAAANIDDHAKHAAIEAAWSHDVTAPY
jgi:hypothetical protein